MHNTIHHTTYTIWYFHIETWPHGKEQALSLLTMALLGPVLSSPLEKVKQKCASISLFSPAHNLLHNFIQFTQFIPLGHMICNYSLHWLMFIVMKKNILILFN